MARKTQGTMKASGSAAREPALQAEVAQVAYELFERRGRTSGHDVEDWLEAERIVRERRSAGRRRAG
jgi:hypothetical protein